MADVTRIEIATRPGFADSRGLSVARAIREHLGLPVGRGPHPRRLPRGAGAPGGRRRRASPPSSPARWSARARSAASTTAPSTWPSRSATSRASPTRSASRPASPSRTCSAARSATTARRLRLAGLPALRRRRDDAARIATQLLANEVIERIGVQTFAEWQASPPDLSVPRVVEHPPRPAGTVRARRARRRGARPALPREAAGALGGGAADHPRLLRQAAAAERRRRRAAGLPPTRPTSSWSAWPRPGRSTASTRSSTPRSPTARRGSRPRSSARSSSSTSAAPPRRWTQAIKAREGKSWLVSVFHDNAGVIDGDRRATTWSSRWRPTTAPRRSTRTAAPSPASSASTAIPSAPAWAPSCSPTSGATASRRRTARAPLPPGLLHPRRIREGVHHGVIDGGNQSGIPYGRGWEFFDERYLGKPLVYCGTVGRMPVATAGRPAPREAGQARRPRSSWSAAASARTASTAPPSPRRSCTEESPVQAVQIGDPITQKMMFDFLLEARDRGPLLARSPTTAPAASPPRSARWPTSRRRRPRPRPGPAQVPGAGALGDAGLRGAGADDAGGPAGEARRRSWRWPRLREVEATDLGEFTADGAFTVRRGGRWWRSCPSTSSTTATRRSASTPSGRPRPPPRCRRSRRRPPPPRAPRQLPAFLARDNLRSAEELCPHLRPRGEGAHGGEAVGRRPPRRAVRRRGLHDRPRRPPHGYALAEAVFPTYSDHRRPGHGPGRRRPRGPAGHRRRRPRPTGWPPSTTTAGPIRCRARRTRTPPTRRPSWCAPPGGSPRSASPTACRSSAARTR